VEVEDKLECRSDVTGLFLLCAVRRSRTKNAIFFKPLEIAESKQHGRRSEGGELENMANIRQFSALANIPVRSTSDFALSFNSIYM
jgi:hypothetical protein